MKLFLFSLIFSSATAVTVRELINRDQELSMFKTICQKAGLFEGILDDEAGSMTVFAPTNDALKKNPNTKLYYQNGLDLNVPAWYEHLVATAKHHILMNTTLKTPALYDGERSVVTSFYGENIDVSQISKTIGSGAIDPDKKDQVGENGVLHVIDHVLKPKFFSNSFAKLELHSEHGPDHLKRVSMVDVVDNVKGRQALKEVRPDGTTYVSCRIRAFNRLGSKGHADTYLTQTINNSPNVKFGELMNESFASESLHNFVQYQLLDKNYYRSKVEDDFEQLIMPTARCGHMWITKHKDKLCFNDGCLVYETNPIPEYKEYLASNGYVVCVQTLNNWHVVLLTVFSFALRVGYILDRCVICSGIGMLVQYASEYSHQYRSASKGLKETSQLLDASLWNLRNLSMSTGNGEMITFFAALTPGYKNEFTAMDTIRLSTLKWIRHLRDFLHHSMLQGTHTLEGLKNQARKAPKGKSVPLRMLTGQEVELKYDPETNDLTIGGARVVAGNIKGVDGLVHIIDGDILKPDSIRQNAYSYATRDFKIMTSYFVFLKMEEDVERMTPLTMFYAPDSVLEKIKIDIEDLSESLLENHVYKELLWCDTLRKMAKNGETIESHNGQVWPVTTKVNNETGEEMPCLKTIALEGGFTELACVTRCDILVRNGIIHALDTFMVKASLETRAPRKTRSPSLPARAPVPQGAPKAPKPIANKRGVPDYGTKPGEKKSGAIGNNNIMATAVITVLMGTLIML